jgi:hypothetical protein
MIRSLRVLGVLGAAALAGAGCTGAIDGAGQQAGKPPGQTGGPPSTMPPGAGSDPGSNPGLNPPPLGGDANNGQLDDSATVPGTNLLRRLTLFEYQNTIRDLLGVTADLKVLKDASDVTSGDSGYLRGGSLSKADDARAVAASAEAIATGVQGNLGKVLPCTPVPTAASEQDACVGKFIDSFGLRAFRRPVAKAEADQLQALYKSLRTGDAGASFERAIGLMVAAILQSPGFLYHWELGPNAPIKDGKFIRFNSYEMASRLSYMLWGTMPDEGLFKAAFEGKLISPEQISAQAKRMMADPKANDALANFHNQWLQIDGVVDMPKNPETFKDFTKDVAHALELETVEFVKSVFTGPKATGKLETLLTSTSSVQNAKLAKLYGTTMAGDDFKEVALNPAQRAGILTLGAFLATKADADDSHPVKRGDKILSQLLCTELSPPPGALIPPVADATPDKTTRQRFAEHSQGTCAACHKMIDPIGFAFENYDAIGMYRTMDNGKPVDASGEFTTQKGVTLKFKNAIEFVTALAKTPEVQDCMATQWMRYAIRRREDGTNEKPSMDAVLSTFKGAGFDIRELMVAITKSRSFTHRTLSAGEVAQ